MVHFAPPNEAMVLSMTDFEATRRPVRLKAA
jgi:hypothetical protein